MRASGLAIGVAAAVAAVSGLGSTTPPEAHAARGVAGDLCSVLTGTFAPDPARRSIAGNPRGKVLFVDFAGARAETDPAPIGAEFASATREYWRTVSHGRGTFELEPVAGWVTLPVPPSHYGISGGGGSPPIERSAALMRDAVGAADPGVNFAGDDIVVLAITVRAGLSWAHESSDPPATADGTELSRWVVMASDSPVPATPSYGISTLQHELAHTLGLPDLYALGPNGIDRSGVGEWDLMNLASTGRSTTRLGAFTSSLVGLVTRRELACLRPGRSTSTLSPLGAPGGRKAVILRVSADKAYVVEVRDPASEPALCSGGVLISLVDGRRQVTGRPGPLQVIPRERTEQPGCPQAGAPYGVGDRFRDRRRGVEILVLRKSGASYVVRVTSKADPRSGARAPRLRFTGMAELLDHLQVSFQTEEPVTVSLALEARPSSGRPIRASHRSRFGRGTWFVAFGLSPRDTARLRRDLAAGRRVPVVATVRARGASGVTGTRRVRLRLVDGQPQP